MPDFEIIIRVVDSKVNVSGPLQEKDACQKVLLDAIIAIHEWHKRQVEQPSLLLANAPLLN